jgi:hypothetical protein
MFLNEDRGYVSWVTHHRQGFVLDGKRKPKIGSLTLHRAACREIKASQGRQTHWTTGSKLKACSLDRAELEAWAVEATGGSPEHCPKCDLEGNAAAGGESQVHLSKLASDILEYVLEAALIHFEIEHPPYHLTVGDIAACFGKTPGQISPALHRLLEGGFVTVQGHVATAAAIPPKRVVLPTVTALRTLESLQPESDSTLQDELAKLEPS